MTPEEFATTMRAIVDSSQADPEEGHADADALLVRALRDAGYDAGCNAYMMVRKWYA
jgi:hypothetical protein